MTHPAPAIGLRVGHRVQDGAPFLHGIAGVDFEIPAGSRVSLRRISPDGTDGPPHVVVFAAPLVGVSDTRESLARARADALWSRPEAARRAAGDDEVPNPMEDR